MKDYEKVDKILRLADLGYSRVEIEQLLAEPKPEKEGLIDLLATEKPAETEEKAEKADEKEPVQQPDARIGALEGKLESIDSTLKAIQSQNIRWSTMPTTPERTELDIVQEILGGIKNNGNE